MEMPSSDIIAASVHAFKACGLVHATGRLCIMYLTEQPMQVVGVKSREILLNAGNIHCVTQQIPAA